MADHRLGTREEWQAARDELAQLEAEQAELDRKVTERRRELPWVAVEKEYRFATEEGEKTLAAPWRKPSLPSRLRRSLRPRTPESIVAALSPGHER